MSIWASSVARMHNSKKADDAVKAALEAAYRKHQQPLRYLARDVVWARRVVPGARWTWSALERSGPLWMAVTAIATAVTAWMTLRGR
jgi:hypothetical protein